MSERRILIADDDPDVRSIFGDYLTHAGYSVQTAADGDRALELAAQSPPDMALLDVMMPGPSGMTLATRLMELYPNVIVLIVTAYSSINLAIEVIQKGAHGYLVKPVRPKQLLDRVEEAWNTSQRGESYAAADPS
ncbi:MAG: response regulator [Anaerolineae bacterium]|nr:response regulator [Anaerolineae bacterium]